MHRPDAPTTLGLWTQPRMQLASGPDAPTFIETQFPVSRLSKESYKERKANYSQTLTGLGS